MSPFIPLCGAIALALLPASPARAATDPEIDAIRNEIRELRSSYEARIRALEERLKDAEARAPAPAAAPLPSATSSSISAFNPAVSVVLQGTYSHFSQPSDRRGFNLAESELALSANVDDKFSGNLIVSLSPDDKVEVEEAYGIYTAAPYSLVPKFGRFLSGIGYLNEQHQHVWDFVDAPLAYDALLGEQYRQDGLQVKWVAPLEHFVELGAEAGTRNGANSSAAYAHTGGDIGESHNWRAGLSYLRTRDDLSIERRISIADFVWKWAPNGNSRQTNFKVQGEYLRSTSDVADRESGWYLQGVYQFMPMWRIGARYDRLDPAKRYSVMVDWSPSEFSRLRLQLARSQSVPDLTDNQVFVQYILSLGAHGAHRY